MRSADYRRARDEAARLVEKFRFTHPPINPEAIAEGMGVDVLFASFKGEWDRKVAGFYDVRQRVIYINKRDNPSRKTFTIAHELGHHILHQEYAKSENYHYMPRNNDYHGEKPVEEKEADEFAANLLVPLSMLRKYSGVANDFELAQLFSVSQQVIRFRKDRL